MVLTSGFNGSLLNTGLGDLAETVLGGLIGVVALAVFTALAMALVALFRRLPAFFLVTFGGALGAFFYLRQTSVGQITRTLIDPSGWEWPFSMPHGLSFPALGSFVLSLALGAGIVALVRSGNFRRLGGARRLGLLLLTGAALTINVAVVASLASDGADPYPSTYLTLGGELPPMLEAGNPAEPGPFEVESLTYGSGENHRRPEFGAERDLESRSVNALPLLKDWKGIRKKMREWYWGFGLSEAPLNARVWAPMGDGPFPLVLVVHGNHGMEDYSDPGYAYLGELLASRGFIMASVDENYINGTWSGDFRGKEMPLRAWFLLEHLKLWRDWSSEPGHRFHGKVDMANIALMGHSRGGEAVSIACAYNELPFYPDDATIPFDYHFSIKSLVSIAQIDQRYHRRVELENVSFLTLHGSYDSDEPAYHGMRQFNRIRFTDDAYRFKAGIYIHRANHGQFNTGWGREDAGPPNAWLLNLAPLIPPEDQREVAKVYISAFLDATLRDDPRYLLLFRDPRVGAEWLPDQAYLHQFEDSSFAVLADFDEDLDVTTATAAGGKIRSDNLALWREEELEHRDEFKQGTSAVVIGWRNGGVTDAAAPSYTIRVPQEFATTELREGGVLSFSVSGSTEKPPKGSEDEDAEGEPAEDDDENEDEEPASPSFSIELEDAEGRIALVRTEERAMLAPPLRVQFMKPESLNNRRYNSAWEPVLQAVEVPLSAFVAANPELDLSTTRYVRFRFDRTPEGVVILDDIGVRSAYR